MSRLLAFLALSVLVSSIGHAAAPAVAVPTYPETRAWLAAGNFAELDRRYGELQRAYDARKLSEAELYQAFRSFYAFDASLEPIYQQWVTSSPKSYVAHLARGIYYVRVGIKSRGNDTASQTSQSQFDALHDAHQKAAQELKASLKLEPKPLLSYWHLIYVYSYASDPQGTRKTLDRGLAADRKSYILREAYMSTLQPRWGGSIEQMRAFVDESRRAGLATGDMAKLNSLLLEEEGWVHEHVEGDFDAAAESYKQAALLDPKRSCERCGPAYKRAHIYEQQNKNAKAVEVATEILQRNPDDLATLILRARNNFKLGKRNEAFTDLREAGYHRSVEAQTLLGKMLLDGNPTIAQRNEAIMWLMQAAQEKDPEAIALLPIARSPKKKYTYTP